jgi:glutathione S-transferase
VESGFLNRNLNANFAFLEDQLRTAPGGGPYLTGSELTAADIMMSMPVIAIVVRALEDQKEKYPLLVKYAETLQASDGYKRAVDKIVEVEGRFKAIL